MKAPFSPVPLIERLEARIAPATFLTPKTVSYVDPDGDEVLIESSKPIFTATLDNLIFAAAGVGEQLQRFDLGASAKGINLSIRVTGPDASSDGQANVGFIRAAGVDLGKINVDGDLGRITAGDSVPATAAIALLHVASLGAKGTATQEAAGSLVSALNGGLTRLEVEGDFVNATLMLGGLAFGKLGSAAIGGSLVGGDSFQSGAIVAGGAIGTIEIGGDLAGGTGESSGAIVSSGKIARIFIGNSIVGGTGAASGQIKSGPEVLDFSTLGSPLTKGGLAELHVAGNIEGGDGPRSGTLAIFGPIGLLAVGGSVIGGDGELSGGARFGAAVKEIRVGGNIEGGIGTNSGQLFHSLSNVVTPGKGSVGGSILGGAGVESGRFFMYAKSVSVGGDVAGGVGARSGSLTIGGTSSAIEIGGSLLSGAGPDSGSAFANFAPRFVVGGDVSGRITFNSGVGEMTVGGSVVGGQIDLYIGRDVTVAGDVDGGFVRANLIKSFHLGGSLIGGAAVGSGRLEFGQAGTIYIAGDITGTRTSTVGLFPISAGSILLGPTKSLIIGGSIETAPGIGGVNDRGSFAILAEGSIGRLEIHGNVLGSETNRAGIYFADYVAPFLKRKTSAVIGAIEIRGRVEWAELASVPTADFATAGNDGITRRVGSLAVYGDWISSTLAVGIDPGADGVFGDGGESVSSAPFPAASSKDGVDKIVIGGRVIGTASAGDVFAFVAPRIGSMTIGGRAVPLTAGPDDLLLSPGTGSDVRVFEVLA